MSLDYTTFYEVEMDIKQLAIDSDILCYLM